MAWIFSLSVECGTSSEAAERVREELVTRVGEPMRTRLFADREGGQWVSLMPEVDPEDLGAVDAWSARLVQELGHLESGFRFGLAGVEVDEVRTWSELVDDVRDETLLAGLVVSDATHAELERPAGFERWGRHWRAS